jgi:hypothetical protein
LLCDTAETEHRHETILTERRVEMANRFGADCARVGVLEQHLLEQNLAPHPYSGELRPSTILPGSWGLTGDVVCEVGGGYVGHIDD